MTEASDAVTTTNGDRDEITTLKSIPLFVSLRDNEVAALHAVMEPNTFSPGETIIREGEEGEHFYVILTGSVQYVTNDASGQELVLDTGGPGAFFGELSMLTGEKRSVRVRATDEIHTLSLNRDEFHRFLLAYPQASIDVLTAISRRLYATDRLIRQSVVPNVNEVMEDKKTIGQRIADAFASMMGSWTFIIVQSAILVVWISVNAMQSLKIIHWDEYPFTFLNLALSFEAAYAAPIIMMSQNRSADKDRLSAEIDHQTNVKAEIKTGQIMTRLAEIERSMHRLHAEQLRHLRTHAAGRVGSGEAGVTGNGSPTAPAGG